MRGRSIGVAALAIVAAVPASAADYMFSYGITTGGPMPTVYASGIITTGASCGTGCFLVTNVIGQNRGAAITGFDFLADSDQQFYPNNASMRVDGSGLTYQVGTTSYNIYATGGGYNEFHFDTDTGAQIGSSAFASFFNVSPAAVGPVPEPATWAMMVGGMALAAGALRRGRRLRSVAMPELAASGLAGLPDQQRRHSDHEVARALEQR